MQRSELTPDQLAAVSLFVETLSTSGWEEVANWNAHFQRDTADVTPPAFGRWFGPCAILELGLHFEDAHLRRTLGKRIAATYLELLIGSKDFGDASVLRLYPGARLGDVLRTIVAHQSVISLDTFTESFMRDVMKDCERVLMDLGEGGLVEVGPTPPSIEPTNE